MFTCKNVIILVVYSYLLLKVIQPNDTQNKILLTVVAFGLICYDWEGFDANKFLEESNINNNEYSNKYTFTFLNSTLIGLNKLLKNT